MSRANCASIPSIGAERDMMISDNRTPVPLPAELIDINEMYKIPKEGTVRLQEMEGINGGFALQLRPRPDEDNLLIRLRWVKNEALPDLKYWQDRRTKGLPYNIQVKLSIYRNESDAKHFMVGLSFRVDYEHLNSYGISIFKTAGRESLDPPNWLNELDPKTFKFNGEGSCPNPLDCLNLNEHYVVVWVKEDKKLYKLLAFSSLEDIQGDSKYHLFEPSNGRLKQWVTLALDLDEQYVGGLKKNEICGEIQGPTNRYGDPIYPKDARIRWDQFIKLKWQNRVESFISDRTLTSKDLEKEQPDEIGIHAFYDNKICEREGKSNCKEDDIYIDGFAVDCINCPSSNTQSIVQY